MCVYLPSCSLLLNPKSSMLLVSLAYLGPIFNKHDVHKEQDVSNPVNIILPFST